MLKKLLTLLVFSFLLMPSAAKAFDYEQCEKKATPLGIDEVAKCKHSQMLLDLKQLQDVYNTLANDKEFKIPSAETKRMYDNWINYRNTYCKMYSITYPYFNENYNKEHCLQEQTKNAYLYMRAITDSLYNDPD